ncbi:ABC transporter substrate-binding protein [Candidatus Auribacterota bacterium]
MIRKLLIIFLIIALFFGGTAVAQKKGKILLLNSDSSIEKYFSVQTVFKKKIKDLVIEVNLAARQINENKIKKIISKQKPEVIYCIGSKAYIVANKLAKNKKLIFSSLINWRRFPKGKNTYGIANELSADMQLMLYRYLFPNLKNIGLLYSEAYNEEWVKAMVLGAKDVGFNIVKKTVKKSAEIETALEELLPNIEALWLISDPIIISDIESVKKIFKRCDLKNKPVFAYNKAFSDYGATLIISADIPTIGRQAAGLAKKLFKNKKISKKVQDPAGSYITLNLKKVNQYQLELNSESLGSVNEIIR